ncbi:MAG: YcxB family protein [Clostridiales bacterium]|nr:YcxB family protein [Clostridiales bacterium]
MNIEFDITLTPKDMYRFNMYQTYTGFQGWFSVIISVFLFVVAGLTFGEVTGTRTLLYVLLGILFLIYMPVTLYLRSKHNIAVSEVLKHPLHFTVGEKGFTVSQKEESAELPWEQIYKMVGTKSNVLVYSSRINAYIIPRAQLGDKYADLAELGKEKLPKYRIKMKV